MPQLARESLIGGVAPGTLLAEAGLTVLRVAVGLMMAFGHGLGKLPPGEGFINMIDGLGFPLPIFFAWATGVAEFLGGLLLAAGALTRLSALAVLVPMLVAAFVAHAGDPLFAAAGEPSREMALLYAAVAVGFLLAGAGRFSADRYLRDWV